MTELLCVARAGSVGCGRDWRRRPLAPESEWGAVHGLEKLPVRWLHQPRPFAVDVEAVTGLAPTACRAAYRAARAYPPDGPNRSVRTASAGMPSATSAPLAASTNGAEPQT